MFTVKQLLSLSQSHRPNLVKNSSKVSIAFGKVEEGKDARGFYRKIPWRGITQGKGKKQKTCEVRIYYPKPLNAKQKYIPPTERPKGVPYLGPEKAPNITVENKVWLFCTCEYFLFHCEVADAEVDNSSINALPRNFYSTKNGKLVHFTKNNGKFPVVTNPGGVAHVCKHLIAGLRKGALLKK